MPDRQRGRIKFYNGEKGYGFLKDDSGQEFFYHITDLEDENYRPQPDDKVNFDIANGKRGLKATNIEHAR